MNGKPSYWLSQTCPTNYLQILAAANREALAVAAASGLQFIRAEGFVFSHVADEGWMDACAGPLLRYRKSIGMEDKVAVVCDIKKKHSAHAVTGDVDIVETAKAARFFRSDGVIVTGASTGHEASPGELEAVLAGVPDLPVLVGSGVSAANLKSYRSLKTNTKEFLNTYLTIFREAHSLIIGSEFKVGGDWNNEIEMDRVMAVMEEARRCRALSM